MSFNKLIVFQKSFDLAMKVFEETKAFPKEEIYSLTDQIRRSSRSVSANVAEGYRKKVYPKSFIAKMVDADGECSETIVHLMYAEACGYISKETSIALVREYEEIGRILGSIIRKPENILNHP